MKFFKFIMTLSIGLLLAYGIYYGMSLMAVKKAQRAKETPLVELAAVKKGHFENRIEAIGNANAKESINVTASVSEFVDKIYFQEGGRVEKDQLLVTLEQAAERAELADAKLLVEDENREYQIAKKLYDKKAVSQTEFDKETYQFRAAMAKLEAVEARIKKRIITAPFSGVTGIRHVSPGALITSGTVITTLDDISIIKLAFTVPETFMAALQSGMSVEAGCAAYPGKKFSGKITVIDSRVDPSTRAITVHSEFDNKDNLIKPGMLMNIEIISDPRDKLSIPEKALLSYGSKSFVYVVGKDMKASKRQITIGSRNFGNIEVLGGLSEGEMIVTEGLDKLNDGDTVRLETPKASPDAKGAAGK